MTHGDLIFCKGKQTKKLTEVKPFLHGINPQHTIYIWENLKK